MSLTLSEFMSQDVKTLRPEQVVLDAMELVWRESVRHIPIVGDEGLVGILTDRDIKRATPSALVPAQRAVWEDVVKTTTVETIMTRSPMTGSPDTTIREALKMFVGEKIGCLPVVDGGKVVGIVTAQDMFKAALKLLGE